MQLAQDISSRMYVNNVDVAGYGEAFWQSAYAFAYALYNRRNRQIKMLQLFLYSS